MQKITAGNNLQTQRSECKHDTEGFIERRFSVAHRLKDEKQKRQRETERDGGKEGSDGEMERQFNFLSVIRDGRYGPNWISSSQIEQNRV